MNPVLLTYSTTDGHTRRICEHLRDVLAAQGVAAQVMPLAQADHEDLAPFGTLVLGASIRYGKHQPGVLQFIQAHLQDLQQKPGVFFSVNAVARKPEKNTAQTNPYMRKFLATLPWQPDIVRVFAGKIDYPTYGWLDKNMIRLIMWLTGGPTDPTSCTEFTDWNAVTTLAHEITALHKATQRHAAAA